MPSTVEGAGQQPSKAHPADNTSAQHMQHCLLVGLCDRPDFNRPAGNAPNHGVAI
jgi:hypothetical protein